MTYILNLFEYTDSVDFYDKYQFSVYGLFIKILCLYSSRLCLEFIKVVFWNPA